jgi:hypothetical protein
MRLGGFVGLDAREHEGVHARLKRAWRAFRRWPLFAQCASAAVVALLMLALVFLILGDRQGRSRIAPEGVAASAAECRADRRELERAETAYHARQSHYTNQAGLVALGYITKPSSLHQVVLRGGGPDSAIGYTIVEGFACE